MNEKDCTRLEEFRQLQKDIRGSQEYLIVGIDVAKEKHTAFSARPWERPSLGGWSLGMTGRVLRGCFCRQRP